MVQQQLEGGAEEASSRRAFASPPDAGGSNASVATMTMADLPITTAEGIDDMDEDELEQVGVCDKGGGQQWMSHALVSCA